VNVLPFIQALDGQHAAYHHGELCEHAMVRNAAAQNWRKLRRYQATATTTYCGDCGEVATVIKHRKLKGITCDD
jgi:hypothetical protein